MPSSAMKLLVLGFCAVVIFVSQTHAGKWRTSPYPSPSIFLRFYEAFLRFNQFLCSSCYILVDTFLEVISDMPTHFYDSKNV